MFDGVHLWSYFHHQSIERQGKKNNLETSLLTFWPHPRKIFNPNDDLKLLQHFRRETFFFTRKRLELTLYFTKFDEHFRNLTGEEFIREILIKN